MIKTGSVLTQKPISFYLFWQPMSLYGWQFLGAFGRS